jgi:putative inorganic carbon (HCO3(-)) transporter
VSRPLQTAARQISRLELVIVLLGIAPILIFHAWAPRWAVLGALVAIPFLWLVRWLGHGSPTRATPLDWPVLVLLLMVLVGLWAAADVTRSLPEVYRILLGVALFYALINTLVDSRNLQLAVVLLLLATAGLGAVALLGTQWGGGKFALPLVGSLYERLPTLVRPFWNPSGFNPNIVGGSLAVLLPIAVTSLFGAPNWTVRVLGAAAALCGGLALLLSQSRGGLVGFALALLAMGVAYTRKFALVVVLLAFIGLGAVLFVGPWQVGQLLLPGGAGVAVGSLGSRLELWSRALYMVEDFPFTGVGLGMFDPVLDMLYPLFTLGPDSDLFHPHNIYLAQAVMAGLPGLIAFVSMMMLLVVMALQSVWVSRSEAFRFLAVGLLGAVVAYLGHGLFDSIDSFIKANTIVWGIFGLQTALWLHLRLERIQGSQVQ